MDRKDRVVQAIILEDALHSSSRTSVSGAVSGRISVIIRLALAKTCFEKRKYTWRILKAQTESGSRIETKMDTLRSSPVYVSAFMAAYSDGRA